MSRTATPAPQSKETPVNEEVIAQDFSAANALALITRETDARVSALALQMGYDGPLTADAVENCIGLYRQRSAEAVLGLGKSILLLKEMVPHGEFGQRLARQNLEERTARRLMTVAVKFGKTDNLSVLKAAGNQAKLLELTVLEDEEIELLGNGGTVLGLNQDDIARMGFMELRKALRESRAEKDAVDKALSDKDASMNKLRAQLKRIEKLPPDEDLANLQKEATAIMNDALGAVRGGMRQALIALNDHPGENDHSLFMAGLVGQITADLVALREEFNLPDVSSVADAQLAAEVAEWSGA